MSPEYKVSIPEGSEHYLFSFVKHIDGAFCEPIKAQKKKTQRIPRDPQKNILLAEKVKEEIKLLPPETQLGDICYSPSNYSYQPEIPDSWLEFRGNLEAGDKLALSFVLSRIRDVAATVEDAYNLDPKFLSRGRKFSKGQQDFIRIAFGIEPEQTQ